MPKTKSKSKPEAPASSICLCILAGGLSTRMGRDKSRVRLGNRTLLGHVKAAALATGSGHPVKIIRRDLVPRCGPLGGILTAFQKHRADLYLFLSCDAPFITATWLKKLITTQKKTQAKAVFTQLDGYASFPFMLTAETLPHIEAQRQRGNYSLQTLARAANAKTLKPAARQAAQFLNVNTPEALEEARSRCRCRGSSKNQAQSSNLNSR